MDRKFPVVLLLLLILVGVLAVQPAAAQGSATWTGNYYNSAYLSGGSVLTRTDSAIAFDWGSGSPDAKVNADNFSVRWGTDVFFQAGTYRFWALADDHIKVNIGFAFQPQINTWDTNNVGQLVSADVNLPAGAHHIQVDYQEFSGSARAFVTWANLATNPSGPNFPAPIPQDVPVTLGNWTGQYYANRDLSGNPTVIIAENTPTHDWGNGAPFNNMSADNFSARWTSLQTLNQGTYRLTVRADDGVRVFVNGQQFINEWHGASGATYTADVSLPFGQHNFMVEYYEGTGRAFLDFSIRLQGNTVPPTVPPPVNPPPVTGGAWLATYFNNRTLSGSPSAIISEISPAHNWGSGAPISSVLPDNFSVRWTSSQTLSAGVYRVTVRADDGVRVLVNGITVINEWHDAANRTYTGDITLQSDTHSFTVEYYEATGLAFLEFGVGPATGGGTNNPGTGTASGSATVTAFRLNVREQPNASSNILTKINQGETYAIVGCNADRSWWQINVNGTVGWVFGSFVNTANVNCSSSSGGNPPPAASGYVVTAAIGVNIRSLPSTSGAILGTIRANQSAQVIGRNSNSTWWQVRFGSITGWVSAGFARIQPDADVSRVPITG
jgi:uncharacterized protein YgiM (DUF1202 family)